MTGFRDRLADSARRGAPVILAADLPRGGDMAQKARDMLDGLAGNICAVKVNMHMLLPLGADDVRRVTSRAADLGVECIADIKLNDIGSTNAAASGILWDMGFDALIANPIMGPDALSELASSARGSGKGVISLCHMSSPQGAVPYEMKADGLALYRRFLAWGLAAGVDGLIVGATYPRIVSECRREAGDAADIISPGVGAQGGSAKEAFGSGSDYIIVGRALVESEDPARTARSLLA